MNTMELVLGIVIVVMIARVLRERYRAQGVVAAPDPEAARLRDEVSRLAQRVQVLERVITDHHQSADLDRQIAALRDR